MIELRLNGAILVAAFFLVAVGSPRLSVAQAVPAVKYRALVIGNSAYTPHKLGGPDNDAHDIAEALTGIGFTVVNAKSMIDLSRSQMHDVIETFMHEVDSDTVAIVYYSGHGLEDDNKNYLVPVDAVLKSYADIESQLVSLDKILKRFEQRSAKTRIIILDACRNLPAALKYTKSFSEREGLAAVASLGPGTSIVYATRPNKVAIAATSHQRNSVFTSALLSAIEKKPPTFMELLTNAAKLTYETTKEKQSPWLNGDILMFAFHFNVPGQPSPPNPLAQPPVKQLSVSPISPPTLPASDCTEISEQIVDNGVFIWRKKCV